MADEAGLVFRFALFSRVFILLFQAIFNFIVTDYDSSSTIDTNNTKCLDKAVTLIFNGFQKWDSVYFIQIAKNGYQYEQYMAFFPLFPWLMSTISTPIYLFLGGFISFSSVLLVVGCSISCVSFSVATVFLYKLSLQVLKDRHLAFISSILFCVNPASVFMSGVYTESLFACCLFSGLYYLEKSDRFISIIVASFILSLGSALRSNGIISCGFVAHQLLKIFFSNEFTQIIPAPKLNLTWKLTAANLLFTVVKVMVSMAIILTPFFAFQLHGYTLFCIPSKSPQNGFVNPPWCYWKIPLSYSYIQNHYWNVGFLKYFELKQIPNFILASPMVILSSMAIVEFFSKNSNSLTVRTLGLWQPTDNKSSSETTYSKGYPSTDSSIKHLEFSGGFHSRGVFVYIAHLAFLTVFGVTSIHVQVVTRLISSSSPVIYWYASHLYTCKSSKEIPQSEVKNYLVLEYFLIYLILGILLHCNFYPWT